MLCATWRPSHRSILINLSQREHTPDLQSVLTGKTPRVDEGNETRASEWALEVGTRGLGEVLTSFRF